MKSISMLLAGLLTLSLACPAFAGEKKPADRAAAKAAKAAKAAANPDKAKADKKAERAKAKGLKGTVVKVDGSSLVITTGKKDEQKQVTIATNDSTKVMVDGKAATLADVKPGLRVTVSPAEGVAQMIVVAGPKAPRDKTAPKPAK